ncbi:bifunctional ornithine acetyltransferase/N-acetylglutamate synthase [Pontibacillus sp. HMF3514]|uniref:bifunctional ornithine acetyltransferase/N-acetylglutamate synthase n=1 Tax=Pontibacillus sp. HMF3514 TaxID=2692425 RepID=UPI001F17CE36|nr:bifunctional ornithine acetyltransferase/N-acetylglutamate synthase [Pontibacillus sp. HMF3514]
MTDFVTEVDLLETEDYKVISDGSVISPQGIQAGGFHCGIKRKRPDLGWIYSEVPAEAAGVYTTNQFQAAPLKVTQESLDVEQKLQSILVNSGVANSCTGEEGLQNAYNMRAFFAQHFSLPEHYTAVVSTGLIGTQIPMEKVKQGINQIPFHVQEAEQFGRSILTTDTFIKHIAIELNIDGQKVIIGGAAKGSGMVHPNMATMLSFITTDAKVDQDDLSAALREITQSTFNMITVDGDTSTNDMVLAMANGMAENKTLTKDHPEWDVFKQGLNIICESLSKMIARDGEGATKLIEVEVQGASTHEAAQKISKTIVGSNLVKSAVFGNDANWGRIVNALGYTGEPIQLEKLNVYLGSITVIENGSPVLFNEEDAITYLNQENIQIFVDLKQGESQATAWGCDLTYDYVKINAAYRT